MKKMQYVCLSCCLAGMGALLLPSCSDDAYTPEPEYVKPWDGAADMNTTVLPGNDFYRYANGGWLARTLLPQGWNEWGPWQITENDADGKLRMMYQSSTDKLIQKYTLMAQDKLNRAERSADALRSLLAEIQRATTRDRLLSAIASMQKAGYSPFFEIGVTPHEFNSRVFLPILKVSSTYFDAERYEDAAFRAAYRQLVGETYSKLFVETSLTDALKMADDALTVQEQLQTAYTLSAGVKQWKSARATDSGSILNLLTQCGITTTCVYDPETNIDVANDLIVNGDLDQLRNYLAICLVEQNAYLVGLDIQQKWLDFEQAYQTGSIFYQHHKQYDVNTANAEDAWSCLNRFVPEFVGRQYAQKYTTSGKRGKMESISEDLRNAFKERLRDSVDWMGEETRNTAMEKLEAVTWLMLQPTSWPKSTEVQMEADNYCAATNQLRKLCYDHKLELFGKQITEKRWEYVLHTYPLFRPSCTYEPRMNAMIITAAFAGEELLDEQDAAARLYGGAGFRMAHELVHGFDAKGSLYNHTGAQADWWKVSDRSAFNSRRQELAERYATLELLPGIMTDGGLVADEAAADLGGLQIAAQAFEKDLDRRSVSGQKRKTERQNFFVSFAQTLAKVTTDDYKAAYYSTSPLAYDEIRVQGTVPAVYRWYDAFDVKSDNRMYLAPAKRTRLW